MKKIKITKNNTVDCSRDYSTISINKCKQCEECFGIVPYSHVLCKRGNTMDNYLEKGKNKKRSL